ncbi:hypothetical protein BJ980_002861 [Nocardioides daedukensis]|uniref:DUF3558 domain-containing protein n=1 Tax=Nocardioides daedukensis TaxID=634462 RepID=A0A7Y9UPT6_9ACTN|nr:hypothetical protein [Nocardioides daedukensis]
MDDFADALEGSLRNSTSAPSATFQELLSQARRESRRKAWTVAGCFVAASLAVLVAAPLGWSAINDQERSPVAGDPNAPGVTEIAPGYAMELPEAWSSDPVACADSSATFFTTPPADPCLDRYTPQVIVDSLDSPTARFYAGRFRGMEPATNAHGIAVRSGFPACKESLPALCSVAAQVPEANVIVVARWRESEPKDREAMLEILSTIQSITG